MTTNYCDQTENQTPSLNTSKKGKQINQCAHRYPTRVLYQRTCQAYLISMDVWEKWMLIIGVWWYKRSIKGQGRHGAEVGEVRGQLIKVNSEMDGRMSR